MKLSRAAREAFDEVVTQVHEQSGHPGRSGSDCPECVEMVEQMMALRTS